MRALLCTLLVALAWPAAARVKIDRYDKATLPEVELWISLLDNNRPVPPADRLEFTVTVNGQIIRDEVEYESAGDRGDPIAVAVVVDARAESWWNAIKANLGALLKLPEGSMAVGYRTRQEVDEVPEKGWAIEPAKLAPVLAEKAAAGDKAGLGQAMVRALKRFPLNPGLTPEPEDEGAPPWKDEGACPTDRVMFVIADGDLGGSERFRSQNMRRIVRMARRRNVRIMGIGIDPAGAGAAEEEQVTVDDQGNIVTLDKAGPQANFDHRAVLKVISRKTGGTYRAAITEAEIPKVIQEARDELDYRYILEFDADALRRGELAEFAVTVQLPTGGADKARSFTARIDNELGLIDRVADWISTLWESLPWWVALIIYVVGGLIIVLVTLIIIVKQVRKRRRSRDAQDKARAAALAARRPCAVCGQMMMPEWTECLFCAQEAAAIRPMRFRLTGRTGDFMGQALRFDREIITIGSDPRCDVPVMDRGVAVQHCGIRDRGGEEFILTDFNTDLGTWVNGERVSQVIIEEGDLLRVGETEFVFGIEAS